MSLHSNFLTISIFSTFLAFATNCGVKNSSLDEPAEGKNKKWAANSATSSNTGESQRDAIQYLLTNVDGEAGMSLETEEDSSLPGHHKAKEKGLKFLKGLFGDKDSLTQTECETSLVDLFEQQDQKSALHKQMREERKNCRESAIAGFEWSSEEAKEKFDGCHADFQAWREKNDARKSKFLNNRDKPSAICEKVFSNLSAESVDEKGQKILTKDQVIKKAAHMRVKMKSKMLMTDEEQKGHGKKRGMSHKVFDYYMKKKELMEQRRVCVEDLVSNGFLTEAQHEELKKCHPEKENHPEKEGEQKTP